ncbi:MAG: hypothetical protein N5P05_002305 [Chroococcopsis gigantea SAG 12.99]|jgi:small subunit ribosomal protein S6|nr:30S ribosomal protein S6 [Chlorogloea purpurea SAG 13.99]MDV3000699.1 hypothetical protein [Chroococcopsis gigantea SAG 12.99]
MNSNYETLYILKTDLSEEQVQQEVDRYKTLISDYGSTDIEIKIWGKKRLAYPIKKNNDGIYVQMNYIAEGKQVAPMERSMRLSEEVIRFLTLKLGKNPPADLTESVANVLVAPVVAVDEPEIENEISAEE